MIESMSQTSKFSSASVSVSPRVDVDTKWGFPTACCGCFSLAYRGKGCVNAFPWHQNAAKQKGHMAWGWKDIYYNLAMESIWPSPAESGKLGQESYLMIKDSSSLCVVVFPTPHKVQGSWARGLCLGCRNILRRWCLGSPALHVLITQLEGHLGWFVSCQHFKNW